MTLKKPYGIFALTDTCLGEYRITTFHYVDFRWYPILEATKIMHKSNIEAWQDNPRESFKFSESPYRNSGDVIGVMNGDYRDCFNEIIEKEKERQILVDAAFHIPIGENLKKVKFQCGIGLQDLTIIEKITKENKLALSLYHIC